MAAIVDVRTGRDLRSSNQQMRKRRPRKVREDDGVPMRSHSAGLQWKLQVGLSAGWERFRNLQGPQPGTGSGYRVRGGGLHVVGVEAGHSSFQGDKCSQGPKILLRRVIEYALSVCS